MFTSKAMRIVWGTNGVLLLLVLLLVLFAIIKESVPLLFPEKRDIGVIVGAKAQKAQELNVDLQHLMYDTPRKISGSEYYFAEIVVIDKALPDRVKDMLQMANDIYTEMVGAVVNVIFFNEDRTEIHKLLDTYGYIKRIDKPHGNFGSTEEPEKVMRDFILYEMALKDTNDDGRINAKDSLAFFITGLDGKNLKQITPFSLQFTNYSFSNDYKEIYFERIEQHEDKDVYGFFLRSRGLYFYNFKTGKFGRFEALDEMLQEVKQEFKM